MTITIESVEEWERVCSRIVNTSMFKLAISEEPKVVKLLTTVFQMGMALQLDGQVEVEL